MGVVCAIGNVCRKGYLLLTFYQINSDLKVRCVTFHTIVLDDIGLEE
jgi:hypothetical protein